MQGYRSGSLNEGLGSSTLAAATPSRSLGRLLPVVNG
jgi:hypothetical protein